MRAVSFAAVNIREPGARQLAYFGQIRAVRRRRGGARLMQINAIGCQVAKMRRFRAAAPGRVSIIDRN
jgi:hypothetical protein